MLALRAVLGEAGHLAVHQQLVAGSFGDVSHLRVHDVLCTRPGRPSLPEICGRLSTTCVLSRPPILGDVPRYPAVSLLATKRATAKQRDDVGAPGHGRRRDRD